MRSKIVSITSKLKWLGLLALFSQVLDNPSLSMFGFFAFLVFFEINILAAFQSIYLNITIPWAFIAHHFKLPAKSNYTCKSDYILPFTGKWTVVNGGSDKRLSHSWGMPSQRYAYDFIMMDDEGNYFSGDNKSVQSYFCYGKDIIAPADGEVVKAVGKYKDSYVDGKYAYCDASDIRGNYVIIKHNDSEHSLIAHIMPGSLSVKTGDKVKQGEIIAKCGNSGNSSMPHIHFQLQLGKNFYTSAGLPIVFNNIIAHDKPNYHLADKRPCHDNLQTFGNKSYIARGLEVENSPQAKKMS